MYRIQRENYVKNIYIKYSFQPKKKKKLLKNLIHEFNTIKYYTNFHIAPQVANRLLRSSSLSLSQSINFSLDLVSTRAVGKALSRRCVCIIVHPLTGSLASSLLIHRFIRATSRECRHGLTL